MRKSSLLGSAVSVFIRLPLAFLLPFVALFGAWTFLAFKELDHRLQITGNHLLESVPLLSRVDDILIGIVLVVLYVGGLLIVYNISAFLGRGGVLLRSKLRSLHTLPAQPYRPGPPSAENLEHQLDSIQKIGIVLAGGGAKAPFRPAQ